MTTTVPILYPVLPEAASTRCTHCWQNRPDLAWTRDPLEDVLRRLCGRCAIAVTNGWPVNITDDELSEMWLWLACQHINHRAGCDTGITDEDIDRALAAHTPAWMPPQAGWQRFEELKHDLLEFQAAEDPATVLDSEVTGPDHDAETYTNQLRGLVDDAVARLIGRRTR